MTLFILSTHVYYIIIVCFLYHLNVHCISYIPREGSLFGEFIVTLITIIKIISIITIINLITIINIIAHITIIYSYYYNYYSY